MPEAEAKEYDDDVKAFFEKFSYEEHVSEHFHTMEIPALDLREEMESARILFLSDMELQDDGAVGFGKV